MRLMWHKRVPEGARGPAISTSVSIAEERELRRLARGKRVLEIGSAFGFTAIAMARSAEYVVTVDHHRHMDSAKALLDNVAAYGARVMCLVADSQQALAALRGCRFDLAFIDGDHTAAGVERDARGAAELAELLAFHDYGEDLCGEVAPALNQLFGCGVVTDTLYVVEAKHVRSSAYAIPR